jgi:hypothetical protein
MQRRDDRRVRLDDGTGVSAPSLPHAIFSLGTAPEYEPCRRREPLICRRARSTSGSRKILVQHRPRRSKTAGDPLPI